MHVHHEIHFHWFPRRYTHHQDCAFKSDAAGETLQLKNVTEIALFALSLSEVALVGLKAVWEMTQSAQGRRIRQIIALKREIGEKAGPGLMLVAMCHFVWPFWELPLCMTQSVSACSWDSLGLLLLFPPHTPSPASPIFTLTDIMAQLSLLMPRYLPIDPIMANNSDNPSVLISSHAQLKLKFEFYGLLLCL